MNLKIQNIIPLIILLLFAVTGCSEIKSDNAKETYKYWTGTKHPANMELFKGQYWQSPHWKKEYIMYLKLKPSKNWWDQFIQQNELRIDTTKWVRPEDAPEWFTPTASSLHYIPSGFSQGSRYFRDTVSGICYMYEIQL